MALTDKLTAVADAVRSQTDQTDKMSLDEMANEVRNLDVVKDIDNTTIFKDDGSIETSYVDGKIEKTVFNGNKIVKTTEKNGVVSKVETTDFKADGSITVTYTKGGELIELVRSKVDCGQAKSFS